jgi:Carboxylesterase family
MDRQKRNNPRLPRCAGATILIGLAAAGIAAAQVPPDIETSLRKIGQIVDPPCTAKLYRPLMPANDINSSVTPLYPGVTIARDVSFGPQTKDVVDIFSADKGGANRTVLMYVSGGAGNKIEQQNRESNAFYDNIGRWGTKNGMVVVLMQRHPGQNWDDPAKDVSAMIQWVEANIGKYNGNPERMFIWAQSAGNGPLGTYIGRPEVWGPKGVGVKGAIFMSGQWNIAPLEVPGAGGRGRGAGGNPLAGMGAACGEGGADAKPGLIAGPSRADPRPPQGAAGRGGFQPPDPATQLQRSTLPEFKKTKVKLLFVTAELDPGINGSMAPFYQTLHEELCKEGPEHCPEMLFEKGESHMSEVFSIDTADKTVSGPILAWMKKVK